MMPAVAVAEIVAAETVVVAILRLA